jgi:hypothetical protein
LVAGFVGRSVFQDNPVRIASLSNVLNWAWLAGALLAIVNAFAVGRATAPFYGGLLAIAVVPIANLVAARRQRPDRSARLPLTYALCALNLAVFIGIVYFIANLESSKPIAYSLVAGYYSTWVGFTAVCNGLSLIKGLWQPRLGQSEERARIDA